jgi:diazepam-binding inhibitor (GABA receptor modulator, acyl-CoA-binding protein)
MVNQLNRAFVVTFFIFTEMTLNEKFESASEKIHTLSHKPANDVLLKLYGLYKQATEGDVAEQRPGGFDFKAMAKYDSWAKLKGKSMEDAKQAYIDLVESLLGN